MGCLGGEGFLGLRSVPCGVIHLIVHTQNNGPSYPQFLISDLWNKGQFGYTTISTSLERIKSCSSDHENFLKANAIFLHNVEFLSLI